MRQSKTKTRRNFGQERQIGLTMSKRKVTFDENADVHEIPGNVEDEQDDEVLPEKRKKHTLDSDEEEEDGDNENYAVDPDELEGEEAGK